MGVPVPAIIVEPFGVNAAPANITLPIPTATQLPANPGRASFNDGFTPANFLPTSAGGIPPSGKDFNGLLYMITAYLAFFQAGQRIGYDPATSTAIGGYSIGAVLQQAANKNASWINTVAGNITNPDTGGAGWISTVPLYLASAPAAGTFNDAVLAGASDYILDVNTAAGNVNATGFVAQRDGQKLVITNTGINVYTLNALTGSAAANQIRAIGDYAIPQFATVVIQYSTGAGKWIVL